MSKGSKDRTSDRTRYRRNYDRIFTEEYTMSDTPDYYDDQELDRRQDARDMVIEMLQPHCHRCDGPLVNGGCDHCDKIANNAVDLENDDEEGDDDE